MPQGRTAWSARSASDRYGCGAPGEGDRTSLAERCTDGTMIVVKKRARPSRMSGRTAHGFPAQRRCRVDRRLSGDTLTRSPR